MGKIKIDIDIAALERRELARYLAEQMRRTQFKQIAHVLNMGFGNPFPDPYLIDNNCWFLPEPKVEAGAEDPLTVAKELSRR